MWCRFGLFGTVQIFCMGFRWNDFAGQLRCSSMCECSSSQSHTPTRWTLMLPWKIGISRALPDHLIFHQLATVYVQSIQDVQLWWAMDFRNVSTFKLWLRMFIDVVCLASNINSQNLSKRVTFRSLNCWCKIYKL